MGASEDEKRFQDDPYLSKYKELSVFQDEFPDSKVNILEVNIIGGVVLSQDEIELLSNNPSR